MTKYDHLRGIADRANHPHIPEPEVAMIFKKKSSRSNEVDMTDLEKKLRKAKKEVKNQFHISSYLTYLYDWLMLIIIKIHYLMNNKCKIAFCRD